MERVNQLDAQYQDLLQYIIENGVEKKDRTGTGTKSVFGYQILHNMQRGFPLLTTKKMAWKQIVTELMWFLRGDTNIKYLLDNDCHIWDGDAYKKYITKGEKLNEQTGGVPDYYSKEEFINKIKTDNIFAKVWGDLGPIYGVQWRSWPSTDLAGGSIDQIKNLIHNLKHNPDSRRLMVSAWNVDQLEDMILPPCHYGFQVWTRELSFDERHLMYCKSFENTNDTHKGSSDVDKMVEYHNDRNIPTRAISLMWNQRSVDTFLGLPFNIASYGLLLEILAKAVNMMPEELIGNLGDVHLYSNHIEQAKEQMGRTPYPLPQLEYTNPTNVQGLYLDVNAFQIKNYQSHPAIKAPLSN